MSPNRPFLGVVELARLDTNQDSLIGNREWGGFQEGGFQIVERAAFPSRGNLLLQGNSYLKSTLRLLLRRRV